MINAIIVDDEPYCCEVLVTLLEKYCPQVNILSSCRSGEEAMENEFLNKNEEVFSM